MGNGRVQLAYLHPNHVSHSFSNSLMRMMAWDIQHDQRIVSAGGPANFRCGTGAIASARNAVVKYFLDETDHEWLLMIDSDMGFDPDFADRLVASAVNADAQIMGALCFAQKELAPGDGMSGWQTRTVPTLYDWAQKPDGTKGFKSRRDYPINEVVRVAGTGAAALLIGRKPLEEARKFLSEAHATTDDVSSGPLRDKSKLFDGWFTPILGEDGVWISEDLSFCALMGSLNWAVYIDTSIKTTHHKEVWLGELHYWREYLVSPATIPTAVIVPVTGRPHAAQRFMESLRASTGLANVYAVTDIEDGESYHAWQEAGATVLVAGEPDDDATEPRSFAQKVNYAVSKTDEQLIFIVGDDVHFYPGWLDQAQHVRRASGVAVVGTNDLGSARVMQGHHATHLLIDREYIEKHGASWDGPGVLAHEGYRHWFVDDEIVRVAKQRMEWGFAMGSIVEHFHPAFGKADSDSVYELGQSHADDDQRTFKDRVRRFANAR